MIKPVIKSVIRPVIKSAVISVRSASSGQICSPSDLAVEVITGGLRLTWTPCADAETELYVSIDGSAYSLITTTGLTIGTYDYACESDGFDYLFKARSKYDTTVLNAPINLVATGISTGVTLTWDDNNTEAEYIEIWADIASIGYVLVATILTGVETYDHAVDGGKLIDYKIRAKEGTLPVYSAYSSVTEITTLWTYPTILSDGNTVGIFEPLATGGVTAAGGVESIYWDMRYPLHPLGAEQSSGVIVVYAVYKITATQENFFYNGCAIGDTFVCGTVKTCDANNKVQRYTGNHLTQHAETKRPTNQIFDGIDNFMWTAPITLIQPTFIYIVFKPITWTNADCIVDGRTSYSGMIYQSGSTPQIKAYAGTASGTVVATLNQYCVIRVLFSGASSKLILNGDDAVTGNFGVASMAGIALGAAASVNWANFQFKEMIVRNANPESAENEATTYAYLTAKYASIIGGA